MAFICYKYAGAFYKPTLIKDINTILHLTHQEPNKKLDNKVLLTLSGGQLP